VPKGDSRRRRKEKGHHKDCIYSVSISPTENTFRMENSVGYTLIFLNEKSLSFVRSKN
jgi:hypothetical protein